MNAKIKKITENKFFMPAVLLVFVSFLMLVLFIKSITIPFFLVLSALFAFICVYLPFEKALGIILFYMPFRKIYTGLWFRVLMCLFVVVFVIKYVIQLRNKQQRIFKFPLIVSSLIVLYYFVRFKYNIWGRVLDHALLLATIYLILANFKTVSKKRLVIYLAVGILSSSLIGGVLAVIPATRKISVYIYENRFQALCMHTNNLQMLCSVCIACLATLYIKKEIKIISFSTMFIPIVIVGLLTKSKAFFIVFALTMLVLLIAQYFSNKKLFWIELCFIVLILVVFKDKFFSIIKRFTAYERSSVLDMIFSGRVAIWKAYLEKWSSSIFSILFGFGLKYPVMLNMGTHSTFLELLYVYGIIGLLLIATLVYSYIKQCNLKLFSKTKIVNLFPVLVVMLICVEETLVPEWGLIIMIGILFFMDCVLQTDKLNKNVLKGEKMNLVSIIIPVYKVEKYLDFCVESVVNQTYKNLEIILVDDGSPDNCPKLCDKWAEKDTRIKVIHKSNGGLSSARNAGIEIAQGEYFCFIDSDDTMHPEMVNILLNAILQTSATISMCSYKKVEDIENPGNENLEKLKYNYKEFNDDEVFDLIYNKQVPLIMAAWAKLYRREIFKEIRYPVGKLHEDEAVIHEILNQCDKLTYVDIKMYNYTHRKDSITTTNFSKKRLKALEIMKERIDFVSKNKPQFLDKDIHHYLRILILYYHHAKWANMDQDILNKIKNEVKDYCDKGYNSSLTKMFFKHPKILNMILKLREKFV